MSPKQTGSPAIVAAIEAGAAGLVPVNIALMRALVEATHPGEVDAALDEAAGSEHSPAAQSRLEALSVLWEQRPEAWALVRQVMAVADHDPGPGGTPLARWTETFDQLAIIAPDAASALYALGDADLLARATGEIVFRLQDWGLTGSDRDALEIGCGSGRFVQALAPLMRSVSGSDISAAMVAQARRRCAGLANVRLDVTGGEGLPRLVDRSVDLILAVDVFPYLVLSGAEVATNHVAEATRLLRPRGSLVVLNYSYRGDPALDHAEIADLAGRFGLEVRRMASGDFSLWDGATFWLAKP